MGWIIYTITRFGPYLGMQGDIDALLACSTTHEQEAIYNNRLRHKIFALLRLMDNRFCLWLFNGVPKAQLDMILAEGTLSQYVERVFDQVRQSRASAAVRRPSPATALTPGWRAHARGPVNPGRSRRSKTR